MDSSPFLRHVLTLMTGTAVAQGVTFFMMIVLARIYTPRDMGLLATYVSVASILVAVAALRYDMAIMLPRKESEALSVARLGLVCIAVVSLLATVAAFPLHGLVTRWWGHEVALWMPLVGLTTFLMSGVELFKFWFNRSSNYRAIAINQAEQQIGVNVGQLGLGILRVVAVDGMLGVLGGFTNGLLVGEVFGGGLFGCGLPGGRGLLVDRVGEDLAQVRGDLRRGARRGGLRVLLVQGLGTLLGRRGDRGLCGRTFLEGSRLFGCGGDRGGGCGGSEELRGVTVEARANRVHVEEEAAVGHLAQVHEVHLDAGGRQHGQSGAHGGVDAARNHDQAGTRADGRGHRIAELRPTGAEALGAGRVLGGEIRPGDRGDLCQSGQGGNEGLGVEFFEDFDGDNLAGHVESCQAGRLLVVLAGHVAPGHGEQGTRDDLQDLLTDSVNEVGSQVLGDRVSKLSGYEVTILELKQGHRSFLHVYGALVAIVSYVPKETWVTRGHCDRYHVIMCANERHSPAISPHEPAAPAPLQVGRIVDQ